MRMNQRVICHDNRTQINLSNNAETHLCFKQQIYPTHLEIIRTKLNYNSSYSCRFLINIFKISLMAHIDATNGPQIQDFLNKNGGIAVVDCHATWCGPCKAIAPYVLDKNKSTGIPLIKVDVDEAPDVSAAYKVTAMPTFLVIKGKWDNIIKTVVGGGQPNVNSVYDFAAANK